MTLENYKRNWCTITKHFKKLFIMPTKTAQCETWPTLVNALYILRNFCFLVCWCFELAFVSKTNEWELTVEITEYRYQSCLCFGKNHILTKWELVATWQMLTENAAQTKFKQYWKLQDLSLAFWEKGQFSNCWQEEKKELDI